MKFKTSPFGSFDSYFSADVFAVFQEKWIFCRHKERTTWEHPSGWIEEGETPLEAAKRELFEETGAVDFELEPLCDYSIDGTLNGYHYKGNGQVYLAMVHRLEEIPPYSEMGGNRPLRFPAGGTDLSDSAGLFSNCGGKAAVENGRQRKPLTAVFYALSQRRFSPVLAFAEKKHFIDSVRDIV